MFSCLLFRDFREVNENAKLKGTIWNKYNNVASSAKIKCAKVIQGSSQHHLRTDKLMCFMPIQ